MVHCVYIFCFLHYTDYQYIGVRLKFGRWYLHEIEPPTIEIGATNHVSDVGIELDPFRIAWTLQDRCKNAFFCATDWHQNIKMNDIPDTSAINDLMETTQKTYAQVLDALRKNKNDVTKTTEYLFNLNDDENDNSNNSKKKSKKHKHSNRDNNVDIKLAKRRFLFKLKESSSKVDPMANNNATSTQKKKNWLKQAQSSTKSQKTRQLAEVYSIEYEVAKLAVDELGYDIAADQLADDAVRFQYISKLEDKRMKTQQEGQKKKKQQKSKWWAFGGGGSNEIKYDDDDYDENGHYKKEYKVCFVLLHVAVYVLCVISIIETFLRVIFTSFHSLIMTLSSIRAKCTDYMTSIENPILRCLHLYIVLFLLVMNPMSV